MKVPSISPIFVPEMHVLIVNTSEKAGGAAIAASRLTDALNRFGMKAVMLVRDAQTQRPTTVRVSRSLWSTLQMRWAFLWERLRIFLANRLHKRGLWEVDIACSGTDITQLPEFKDADIIHLHWINQGMLSLRQIARILRSGKPVVWTMHDMWPCTAICHHAGDCNRFTTHCHSCPQLLYPDKHDLSWQVFQEKVRTYALARMTFVAVSNWMADRARQSALTAGHTIQVIPNPLPINDFHRMDSLKARLALGLAAEDAIVAFGAARIDAPVKGLPLLAEALMKVQTEMPGKHIHLLLFGDCKDRHVLHSLPCSYTFLGRVNSTEALCRIYSAANVLVNASAYETFGQTLAEAMACGCVPVSFDRGGQTDVIRHLQDGYLARYGDTTDMAQGIRWALTSPPSPDELQKNAASRFGEAIVAQQHIELYQQLL